MNIEIFGNMLIIGAGIISIGILTCCYFIRSNREDNNTNEMSLITMNDTQNTMSNTQVNQETLDVIYHTYCH